jgi:hypothetical protein
MRSNSSFIYKIEPHRNIENIANKLWALRFYVVFCLKLIQLNWIKQIDPFFLIKKFIQLN